MSLRWIERVDKSGWVQKVLQQTENPVLAAMHPELWADVPTHQEPKKGFRQAVNDIVVLAKPNIYDGYVEYSADEATDRILAICKEMLVPAEDNQGFGTATVSPSKTWNACRSELLKQLGE